MQKWRTLAIGLLVFSVACNGEPGVDSPTTSGQITDWPSAKTGSVRVSVVSGTPLYGSSTAVNASGRFSNLNFPGLETIKSALTPYGGASCVTFSSKTVKKAGGYIEILNPSGLNVGIVSESNRPTATITTNPAVGDKTVSRVFVDGNLSIRGSCASGQETDTYDMNLLAGWNVIINEITAVSGTTVTALKISSGVLPSDVKLYYSATVGATLSIDRLNR